MAETTREWLYQAAAIPIRNGQICLVSSRSGKRWIAPKGLIDPGKTAGETALLEAWEEAGLVGRLSADPSGAYVYQKWGKICHVTVFPLTVTTEAEEWPEQSFRKRLWLDVESAAARVTDEGLRDLIMGAVNSELAWME